MLRWASRCRDALDFGVCRQLESPYIDDSVSYYINRICVHDYKFSNYIMALQAPGNVIGDDPDDGSTTTDPNPTTTVNLI